MVWSCVRQGRVNESEETVDDDEGRVRGISDPLFEARYE